MENLNLLCLRGNFQDRLWFLLSCPINHTRPPYLDLEGGPAAVWETIILLLYLLHRLVEAAAASATRTRAGW